MEMPNITQPVRLGFLVVALLAITIWYAECWSNPSGEEWAAQWLAVRSSDSLPSELVLNPTLRDKEPALSRLRQQLTAMEGRKEYHARLAIFFLSRHNTTLTILVAAGLVAAAMLLIVTARGMAAPSPYVKVTFVTATAVATFAGGLSSMHKQEANAARNAALFISYENLQNHILTFMAGGRVSAADSAAGPTGFIASVDSSMAVLNDLAIGFDESAAPSLDELFKKLALPGGP